MNTTDIMALACRLAGFDQVPADSRIYYPAGNISRILFGIDIWPKDLKDAKAKGFDLIISHHPPGLIPGPGFLTVLNRYQELLVAAGVPAERARATVIEVKALWQANPFLDFTKTHDELTALARELSVGLMNIHLPLDEVGRRLLQRVVEGVGPQATVAELMTAFEQLPELTKTWEDVRLICGDFTRPIGKTVVAHGAGANGDYPVANTLFECGIETVIYISFFPQQRAAGRKLRAENKGNLIVTGHYASDSLGINPLLDELAARGIVVEGCNKLIR